MRLIIVVSSRSDVPRQLMIAKENRQCSILFHLLVPGGRWPTEILKFFRPIIRQLNKNPTTRSTSMIKFADERKHTSKHCERVTTVRERCDASGTAFFFMQWGDARPKSGGRELDGGEWNGFPWRIVPDTLRERLKMGKNHQMAPKKVLYSDLVG